MFLEQDVFEGLKPTLQNPPSYEKARIGFVPYNPTTDAADSNSMRANWAFPLREMVVPVAPAVDGFCQMSNISIRRLEMAESTPPKSTRAGCGG
jgi:hypothetical protein